MTGKVSRFSSHPFYQRASSHWSKSIREKLFYSFLYLLGHKMISKGNETLSFYLNEAIRMLPSLIICVCQLCTFPPGGPSLLPEERHFCSYLLSSASKCFLWIDCCPSIQCCTTSSQHVICTQLPLPSLSSCGFVPSHQLSVVSMRPCHHRDNRRVTMCIIIWTSAAYILLLMSFPIVFSLNYLEPASLLDSFPSPP